jgi:hypothetical protein
MSISIYANATPSHPYLSHRTHIHIYIYRYEHSVMLPRDAAYCFNFHTTQTCGGGEGRNCTCIIKLDHLPKYTQLQVCHTNTHTKTHTYKHTHIQTHTHTHSRGDIFFPWLLNFFLLPSLGCMCVCSCASPPSSPPPLPPRLLRLQRRQ